MEDTYRTITNQSEGLYKEKGSKFIAFAFPVQTEEQIKDYITLLKDEYFDARHHCYAYVLGAKRDKFRMNDDGEPSSTAGKPIYGQILSNDLTDILIVVIRYFGGTKLGVPGLINAYKTAAADAIANAEIVERTVNRVFTIQYDYIVMNSVMKIIKECNPEVLDRRFENLCTMVLSIRESEADALLARLEKVETLTLIS
ncbi:MAG: YigZ family protein [Bacteroidales bacterium]|nr:YigZ family protein [Bacteroidales bacterium]